MGQFDHHQLLGNMKKQTMPSCLEGTVQGRSTLPPSRGELIPPRISSATALDNEVPPPQKKSLTCHCSELQQGIKLVLG